jgi:hypothetical protein
LLVLCVCVCILTFLNALLGGQKSRVAFAKITFKKPHIILLDEPSNHLVGCPISSTLFITSYWLFAIIFCCRESMLNLLSLCCFSVFLHHVDSYLFSSENGI